MAAASLFSEIRDAVLPPLKAAEPTEPIASRLHDEAERLLMNPGREELWRLDLTQQHLGADEHPIHGQERKELEFDPTRDPVILEKFSRETGYRPHARIIDPANGKVIEVRPITAEEAREFQPALPKEGTTPQRADAERRREAKEEAKRLFVDKLRQNQPDQIKKANEARRREIIRKSSSSHIERELLRLRQEYHLMDDDKSWEEWRPKLERLASSQAAGKRRAAQLPSLRLGARIRRVLRWDRARHSCLAGKKPNQVERHIGQATLALWGE